jgi:ribosomal 30S subunit maturation factor RimM
MGLGLLALGQMPKSQGMPGLMSLLASQDAAAKNKADSAWQEEARGRQRKEWEQADAAAASRPHSHESR